jgi:hypothetical protein
MHSRQDQDDQKEEKQITENDRSFDFELFFSFFNIMMVLSLKSFTFLEIFVLQICITWGKCT